jgi:hypothetical protein
MKTCRILILTQDKLSKSCVVLKNIIGGIIYRISFYIMKYLVYIYCVTKTKQTTWLLVRKRTILTGRLLGWKSKLSTSNKVLTYKAVLKPIWAYGIQLWSMASTSNLEVIEPFQSEVLHMIVDTPWYVSNMVILRYLQMPTVKEEICHHSSQYSVHLSVHPNDLVVNLMVQPDNRRL